MAAYQKIDPPVNTGPQTTAGWQKCPENPVLGPTLGTAFDGSVLHDGSKFHVWFSWRDNKSIGYCTSEDGVHWDVSREPVLAPRSGQWDADVNRPSVIRDGERLIMWYSGALKGRMLIGMAESTDGIAWRRRDQPVLTPEAAWEKQAVMCPCVLREEAGGKVVYKMWYSGGETYEPDALGYATSNDGVEWRKHAANPVFRAGMGWESARVAGCDVQKVGDAYYLFYIGYKDGFENTGIGVAKSPDGIGGWQRHPENPIIRPGPAGAWDDCNVYKPFICRVGDEWYLWYNASRRSDRREQIGLARHSGFAF